MKALNLFLLIITYSFCFGQSGSPRQKDYKYVSMVSIIANPEAYQGQNIRIYGYLNLEFENTCLYMTKEAYQIDNSIDAIDILIPDSLFKRENIRSEDINHKYVIIRGRYKKHNNFLYSGLIEVTSIESCPVKQ